MSDSVFSKVPIFDCAKRAQDALRRGEKRRREVALEEGKRDQARLLSSAKLLYKLGTQTRSTSAPSSYLTAVDSILHAVRQESRRDYIRFDKITEEQSLTVRALAACEGQPSGISRRVTTIVLKLPDDASNDRIYRAGARLVHPDKCRHPLADSAFKILSSLYKQQ